MPACWPGRPACSPELELPRQPSSNYHRARLSALFPSLPAIVAPSLGHKGAPRATHWLAWFPTSPESTLPRPRRHGFAAAARRRRLRPILLCKWVRGKLYHRPVPLDGQLWRPLAAGEPFPGCRGYTCGKLVSSWGVLCELGTHL
jgi:hypothetical protein